MRPQSSGWLQAEEVGAGRGLLWRDRRRDLVPQPESGAWRSRGRNGVQGMRGRSLGSIAAVAAHVGDLGTVGMNCVILGLPPSEPVTCPCLTNKKSRSYPPTMRSP